MKTNFQHASLFWLVITNASILIADNLIPLFFWLYTVATASLLWTLLSCNCIFICVFCYRLHLSSSLKSYPNTVCILLLKHSLEKFLISWCLDFPLDARATCIEHVYGKICIIACNNRFLSIFRHITIMVFNNFVPISFLKKRDILLIKSMLQ